MDIKFIFLLQYGESLILIAEQDYPYGINNSGFDAGWDYSYHHALLANIIGFNHEGHIWGDMNDIASHIDAYSQGYSDHTGQLIYTESHDEPRVIYESTVYPGVTEEVCGKIIEKYSKFKFNI